MESRTVHRTEKAHIPHAKDSKRDAHGKPDWQACRPIAMLAIEQLDAGHCSLEDVGQVDTANGSHDDEKALIRAMRNLKPTQKLLWFVRDDAPAA